MIFTLTSEQQMLRDSVARFARDHYGFETWRRQAQADQGFDPRHWQHMADMGWLALGLPEDVGGMGGTAKDVMVLMEELGRCLALEPYVSTCVLAASVLARAGSAEARGLCERIATGAARVAVASEEADARFDPAHVRTTASPSGDGFVLSGEKSHVPDADTAGHLIVSARTAGAAGDAQGITLFLVPAEADGVHIDTWRGADYLRASRVTLQGVRVSESQALGPVGGGLALLDEARDRAALMRMAEALGAMDEARDITLAYLKTREQFGRKIGVFQALQHRMVDMAIACEEARAIVYAAAAQIDEPAPVRARAVSAAKVQVGRNAMYVGHQAVQLHGGIGTSDELIISHYLKRLGRIDAAYGNPAFHLARFAAHPVQ
ncbi:acyl-CoA dehydrogenase family protein [Achromobacter sp. GG226]|uniref:acyl-CoA dehydrogenase family protein n=1 Tax=Verticiella alkaliphila TaxID=2779529 RepID=UPI001C0D1A1C|nr:acyl-CoA dehydrogenase [Verticiella sp. GG226]MBU4610409.1 acyl-CoA dehydrogenase family protein [Verticiella sp. GG226]